MQGYEVRTHDDERAATVVDREGAFLIVEHGVVFKHRRALPVSLVSVDDDEQVVRTAVSRELLETAPEVEDGELDVTATERHYGLAAGEIQADAAYNHALLEAFDDGADGEPAIAGLTQSFGFARDRLHRCGDLLGSDCLKARERQQLAH